MRCVAEVSEGISEAKTLGKGDNDEVINIRDMQNAKIGVDNWVAKLKEITERGNEVMEEFKRSDENFKLETFQVQSLTSELGVYDLGNEHRDFGWHL